MREIFNFNFRVYNFLLIVRKSINNDRKYAFKGTSKLVTITKLKSNLDFRFKKSKSN